MHASLDVEAGVALRGLFRHARSMLLLIANPTTRSEARSSVRLGQLDMVSVRQITVA